MTRLHTNQMVSRRAVAPVIATLLLVAIAVVGGSIIFVFSQGFFSSAQISGAPQIESIEITGYDLSDAASLTMHDGGSSSVADGTINGSLDTDERVAVYVQNQSAQTVVFDEIKLGGATYTYAQTATLPVNAAAAGTFYVVYQSDGANPAITSNSLTGELGAGRDATIVFDLSQPTQIGRDVQFKIDTANGATFVGTAVGGQLVG